MSNIAICPYGHWFSKTRHGSICPECGFDIDTPEKMYIKLRKEYDLPLEEDRPVCAWLVCIDGARMGKSYKLVSGANFIGKDKNNEVQILGSISLKDKHTLLYFDIDKKEAALLPSRADGIVYKDNMPLYDRYVLNDNDVIEFGESKYIYASFLGKYKKDWQYISIIRNEAEEKEINLKRDRYIKARNNLKTEEEKYVERMLGKKQSLEEAFPVCAWLVCIEGVRKGQSYNIIEGKNYIGKDDIMNIQILGDEEIRDKNHAVIAFDTRSKTATLLGEESRGFVRVNETAIYKSRQLNNTDVIDIGNSSFMYVRNGYNWSIQ